MASINTHFNVTANTSAAQTQMRNLLKEAQALNQNVNQMSRAAVRDQQRVARAFGETASRVEGVSASLGRTEGGVAKFTTALTKGNESLEYYRRNLREMRKNNSQILNQMATDQVKMLQSQTIALTGMSSKMQDALILKPLHLDTSNFNTAMQLANQRAFIMNKTLEMTGRKLVDLGKNTQWAGRQIMVGITIPLGLLASQAVKTFHELDRETVRFRKVYGGAMNDIANSSDEAVMAVTKMATEFTAQYGIAARDTMSLAADLAATGKEGAELEESLRQTTRLAVLGEVERQEAMQATLSIQSAFKQNTDELAESIDFLNAVENSTSTSLRDLSEAIPKAGPVVKQLGGDIKDLSALIAAMREGGIPAAEAANALKSGLASLINPTAKAANTVKEYGINIRELVNANQGDLMGTITAVGEALNGLNDFARAQVIEELFGKFQFARISTMFANITDQASQASKVIDLAGESAASLGATADRELKTLSESASVRWAKAIEEIKTALIPLGEFFSTTMAPAISAVAKVLGKITDWISGNSLAKWITGLTVGVAAVAGPFLMIYGILKNLGGQAVIAFSSMGKLIKRLQGYDISKWQIMNDEWAMANTQVDKLTNQFGLQTKQVNLLNEQIDRYVRGLGRIIAAGGGIGQNNPPGFTGTQARSPKYQPYPGNAAQGYSEGGRVGGYGNADTVPAWLTPGEFVINKDAAMRYRGLLEQMNQNRFAEGGSVGNVEEQIKNLLASRKDAGRAWLANKQSISRMAQEIEAGRATFAQYAKIIEQLSDEVLATVTKLSEAKAALGITPGRKTSDLVNTLNRPDVSMIKTEEGFKYRHEGKIYDEPQTRTQARFAAAQEAVAAARASDTEGRLDPSQMHVVRAHKFPVGTAKTAREAKEWAWEMSNIDPSTQQINQIAESYKIGKGGISYGIKGALQQRRAGFAEGSEDYKRITNLMNALEAGLQPVGDELKDLALALEQTKNAAIEEAKLSEGQMALRKAAAKGGKAQAAALDKYKVGLNTSQQIMAERLRPFEFGDKGQIVGGIFTNIQKKIDPNTISMQQLKAVAPMLQGMEAALVATGKDIAAKQIRAYIDKIPKGMRDALNSGSPSKETEEAGEQAGKDAGDGIVEGVEEGLEASNVEERVEQEAQEELTRNQRNRARYREANKRGADMGNSELAYNQMLRAEQLEAEIGRGGMNRRQRRAAERRMLRAQQTAEQAMIRRQTRSDRLRMQRQEGRGMGMGVGGRAMAGVMALQSITMLSPAVSEATSKVKAFGVSLTDAIGMLGSGMMILQGAGIGRPGSLMAGRNKMAALSSSPMRGGGAMRNIAGVAKTGIGLVGAAALSGPGLAAIGLATGALFAWKKFDEYNKRMKRQRESYFKMTSENLKGVMGFDLQEVKNSTKLAEETVQGAIDRLSDQTISPKVEFTEEQKEALNEEFSDLIEDLKNDPNQEAGFKLFKRYQSFIAEGYKPEDAIRMIEQLAKEAERSGVMAQLRRLADASPESQAGMIGQVAKEMIAGFTESGAQEAADGLEALQKQREEFIKATEESDQGAFHSNLQIMDAQIRQISDTVNIGTLDMEQWYGQSAQLMNAWESGLPGAAKAFDDVREAVRGNSDLVGGLRHQMEKFFAESFDLEWSDDMAQTFRGLDTDVQQLFTGIAIQSEELGQRLFKIMADLKATGLEGKALGRQLIAEGTDIIYASIQSEAERRFFDKIRKNVTQQWDAQIAGLQAGADAAAAELQNLQDAQEDFNDAIDQNIENLNNAKEAAADAHEAEMEALDDRKQAMQDAHDDEMDRFDERRDAIQDNLDAYLKALDKQKDKEDYLARQRQTATGAMSALASGDVAGFIGAKREFGQNAAEYGIEQQRRSMQELADARLENIDAAKEAEDKAFEKRMDQIDQEREAKDDAHKAELERYDELIEAEAERKDAYAEAIELKEEEIERWNDQISKATTAKKADLDRIQAVREEGYKSQEQIDKMVNKLGVDLTGMTAQYASNAESALTELADNVAGKMFEIVGLTKSQGKEVLSLMRRLADLEERREQAQKVRAGSVEEAMRVEIERVKNKIESYFDVGEGYATGGLVRGPGSGKSDSIPARLSNGEYVINAEAVKKVGTNTLDNINARGTGVDTAEGGGLVPNATQAMLGAAMSGMEAVAKMFASTMSAAQESQSPGTSGATSVDYKDLPHTKRQHPPFKGSFPINAGYTYSSGAFHGAYDYGTPNKTPLYAVRPGKIISVKDNVDNNGFRGNTNGGNNLQLAFRHKGKVANAFYQHLYPGSIKPKVGQMVKAGQLLAMSGNSGNSTGPHLHFGTHYGHAKYGADNLIWPPSEVFMRRGGIVRQDGTRAFLHRGEMVLPQELSENLKSALQSPFFDIVKDNAAAGKMAEGMTGGDVTINVNGAGDAKEVANLVMHKIKTETGRRTHSRSI